MKNKLIIPLIVIFLFSTGTALPATFTVTNTNDGGPGSLREAILAANLAGSLDSIEFNIPSSDSNCALVPGHGTVCTISLGTQADIVFPVIINGYTQPGTSPNTNPITMGSNAVLLIEIRSPHPPGSQNFGLVFGSSTSGSTVRGLVMNRFSIPIVLGGTSNNLIDGNFIGTDPTGTVGLPNATAGVRIISGANNNTVGGMLPAARNVISGNSGIGVQIEVNSSGNIVQGNFIGTNAAGNSALGNAPGTTGITVGNNSPNTLIGGDSVAARNVIVPGFQGSGIDISNTHSGVQIRGNFIGTDLTGTTRLENSSRGINLFVTTGVVVGEPTATPGMPPGNLIASGNYGIGGQSISNLTVQGNLIGTDINGAVKPYLLPPIVGITYGLSLGSGATALVGGTGAGEGNVIAGHTDGGITSTFSDAITAAILGNSIHSNGGAGPSGLGIDLGSVGVSGNDACDNSHPQNFPEITSAAFGSGNVTLSGTLDSVPNTTFRLEFFSSPFPDPSQHGEGRTFIGSANVTTDSTCNGSFGPLLLTRPIGHFAVSSTATRLDAVGTPTQTSEFAENVTLVPTAANVSISGRVLSSRRRGISGVQITLADQNGTIRSTTSGTFGFYEFQEVPAGQNYTLTVSSRRYTFENPTQIVPVSDPVSGVDFFASARGTRD